MSSSANIWGVHGGSTGDADSVFLEAQRQKQSASDRRGRTGRVNLLRTTINSMLRYKGLLPPRQI